MASQQFFLRWDNYSNYISYAFGTLRSQEDLVDVTLSCEGKKIRAHKVLLSACSSYFRDVFKDNPCQHPVIVFKNVKYDDLLAIIEFMYQGEVSVAQDALPSFLNTAELLSVQGLIDSNSSSPNSSSANIIDTTATQLITTSIPKTVTIKPQQTVTLCPDRRFVKKVYAGQSPTTTIKTVSHPITVFSPKTGPVTRKMTTVPVKLSATTSGGVMVTTSNAPTFVTATQISDSSEHHHQSNQTLNQLLVAPANASGTQQHQQVKRKRILFDSEDNISIEDVNYVKQQIDMEMPNYIEIQTTSGGGDDDKGLTSLTAEDLLSGAESDSQAQETVTIEEEAYDGQGDDDDEDKDKEMEITYTEEGDGTVVLTPVREGNKDDQDKQVNYVQGEASNTKWSQCSFCKLVITSVNLWRHIRTQHTAQQPMICTYCQKNFKNKYSLREHIRIAHEHKTSTTGSAAGSSGKSSGGGSGQGGGAGNANSDTEIVILKSEK